MRSLPALVLGLFAVSAHAEDVLSGDQIKSILSDVTLSADAHGAPIQQIFQAGGQTFVLANGGSSAGSWKVEENRYCSIWPPNPSWSCYDVMQDGRTITFRSADGTRYPMTIPAKSEP